MNEFFLLLLMIIIWCMVVEILLKVEINFSIRGFVIYGVVLKEIYMFVFLVMWVDQIVVEDVMMLILDFNGICQLLYFFVLFIGQMFFVFQCIRSLSRFYMICCVFNFFVIFENLDVFFEEDFQDIDFGFDFLRGVQRFVIFNIMEVDLVGLEVCKFIIVFGEFFIQIYW